jgi:hypothetical protein
VSYSAPELDKEAFLDRLCTEHRGAKQLLDVAGSDLAAKAVAQEQVDYWQKGINAFNNAKQVQDMQRSADVYSMSMLTLSVSGTWATALHI